MMNKNGGVTPLKCPRCGAAPDGGEGCVFACWNCEIGLCIEPNGLGKYRLLFIKPTQLLKMKMLYFPFWFFRSRFQLLPNGPEQERDFLIPAFFIKSIGNYGDIGFFYFQKGIVPIQEPQRRLEICPGERDILTASRYPAIYLAKQQSEKIPLSPESIVIQHLAAALALVPFYTGSGGSSYIDSQISWKYPPGALR